MTPTNTLNPDAPDLLVLAAFNSPDFHPATSEEQLMIVGTGGVGLWERQWQHFDTADDPRTLRAMRLAMDLARPHLHRLNTASLHHYALTPDGQAQHERFADLLPIDAPGASPPRQQTNPLIPFVQAHPNDWDGFFTSFETLCRHTLEFGQHLTLLALLDNRPTTLGHARSVIALGPDRLDALVRNEIPTAALMRVRHALQPWPGPLADPAPEAIRAPKYVDTFLSQFNYRQSESLHTAVQSVTTALTARTLHTAHRQTTRVLADMPVTDDRIPMAMRELADAHLHGGRPGIGQRIQTLLSNLDPKDTLEAFTLLQEFQEALLAVAFTNRLHTGDRQAPYARRLAELQRQDPSGRDRDAWLTALLDNIPPPSWQRAGRHLLQEAIKDQARYHLRDAASPASPFPHYHFHQGTALLDFLATTSVQACVAAVRHNPDWHAFLQQATRQQ